VFMVTSLLLAFMTVRSPVKTVIDDVPRQEAPATPGQAEEPK